MSEQRPHTLITRIATLEQECSRLARKLAESQARRAEQEAEQEAKLQAGQAREVELRGLLGAWWGFYSDIPGVPAGLNSDTETALAFASPVAETIERVVDAAEGETEAELRTERASGSEFDHYYDEIEPARDRRRAAVAALQALRAGQPRAGEEGP